VGVNQYVGVESSHPPRPSYARSRILSAAHGMAAWCHLWRHVNGWTSDRSHEEAKTQYLV
jgi:hypothetical protein